ncbi:hypothetical protein CDA63_02675 [Hymenobacter amundsenii]|uniref:DUF4142 domain-containing protein n=1 Tax=Hymenobacter amundsenii TaxID=2006685 RepID=A0A246FPL2_9BACT|nr:DUF4142 domain-containing protein [Hymenobacter amundsenii]OWP64683.1 hypothetical protein CDA63_02675 [Hymenobacter amundsenii]
MKLTFTAALCAGALLTITACNPTTDTSTASTDMAMNDGVATDTMGAGGTAATSTMMTDDEFMKMVATGGHNEMGLSQVALDKGATGATKDFANMMITDHTKAGNELKSIADSKSVLLPADMDAEHKALQEQMQNLSGEQLAQKYAQQMVTDHQNTVDMFQSEIQNGQDAAVKAFASKTLPTIQEHLSMAKKLPGAMTM